MSEFLPSDNLEKNEVSALSLCHNFSGGAWVDREVGRGAETTAATAVATAATTAYRATTWMLVTFRSSRL